MKVVILAGGYGSRFGKLTDFLPKPMIPIGPHPIIYHIMRSYAHHGFKEFVICTGYRADLIKDYFLRMDTYNSDFVMDYSKDGADMLRLCPAESNEQCDWKVTVAYTGLNSMTGSRIKRIARYLDDDVDEDFLLTYGDGVSDVDISESLQFHRDHGKIATVTAVYPPPKFGDLRLEGTRVTDFSEKTERHGGFINGGFYVFRKELLDHLDEDKACILEKGPLDALAKQDHLRAYRHSGYWQCMDTTRDMELLNDAWMSHSAPWKVWEGRYTD